MRGIHYGTTINDSAVRFTPLTRGIRTIELIRKELERFTPAHAGNTPSRFFADWIAWVHPRSRGEYYILCNLYCIMVDSPPPMRGILSCYSHNSGYNRFTPAHAGNTVFISSKPTTV